MAFNSKKYLSEKRRASTGAVEVPELKDYFDDGDELMWPIKGILGDEFICLNNSIGEPDTLIAAADAIGLEDKIEAIKESLGIVDDFSISDRRNMKIFVSGSTDESVTMEVARVILRDHQKVYFRIVNAIAELTGIGAVPGKPKDSGEIQE